MKYKLSAKKFENDNENIDLFFKSENFFKTNDFLETITRLKYKYVSNKRMIEKLKKQTEIFNSSSFNFELSNLIEIFNDNSKNSIFSTNKKNF